MKFGDFIRNCRRSLTGLGLAALVGAAALGAPQAALAAADAAAKDSVAAAATPPAAGDHFTVAPGGYTPMKPQAGKGQPVDGGYGFQDQYSANGEQALWIHNAILLPIVFGTAGFVGLLLLFVMFRFRKGANPVPSKTSHNTVLEIVWTGVPVLILAFVAIYSIDLIARQYKPAPKNALTVKATGNQWYWTYSYPDNGGFEVTSNILKEAEADARGEPRQLAADYRMVVPAGEPIRLQTIGADVIHSFAVPSLWFKLDAVPGKINERQLVIKTPGVYYGQCSELCGARHGYMPIVVEALDRPHFNAWVMSHSGAKIDGAPEAPKAADAAKPAEAPKAAEAASAAKPA